MPLGLAKDSMLNLAEMASKKDGDHLELEDPTGQDGEKEEREQVGEADMNDVVSGTMALDSIASKTTSTNTTDVMDVSDSSLSSPDAVGVSPVQESNSKSAATDAADAAAAETKNLADSNAATPAPETSKIVNGSSTTYGQYAGFSADYADYQQYGEYQTTYSDYQHRESNMPTLLGGKQKKDSNIWCCVFPWMDASKPEEMPEEEQTREALESVKEAKVLDRSTSKDDDEVSTGSDAFGEKLSDKDRQAVLARLRLAQPDAGTGINAIDQPQSDEKGLLKGIVSRGQAKDQNGDEAPRGILKHSSARSMVTSDSSQSHLNQNQNGKSAAPKQRRSLFPQYEPSQKVKKNLSCSFAPMARAVSVKSQKDMTEEEKADIWWQKSDYEEFRRTGRMITKAMLDGGSEIWLASNRSWRLPNHNKSSMLKQAYSLSDRQRAVKNGNIKLKKEHEATRDKWWHTFGHSRRGLEHVASIDEGKQRQANVRKAIRSVVEEQRRQKVFHREDADKLRMVSIHHTIWARDLALAAGASDADAVRANFEESRKSREFYLLKLSRSNPTSTNQKEKHMPAFMRPAVTVTSKMLDASRLDANTVSQIRYRRAQVKKKPAVALAQKQTPDQTPAESVNQSVSSTEQETPIRDDEGARRASMAKRAAGFSSGEEVANMSAVLTGMGLTEGTVGGP